MAVTLPFDESVAGFLPFAPTRRQLEEPSGAEVVIEPYGDRWIVRTMAWAESREAAIRLTLKTLNDKEAAMAPTRDRVQADSPQEAAPTVLSPADEERELNELESRTGAWRRPLPPSGEWVSTPVLRFNQSYELLVRGTYTQDGHEYDAFHLASMPRPAPRPTSLFDSSHTLRPVGHSPGDPSDEYRWRLYGNGVPLRIRFCPPSGARISGTLEAELCHSPVNVLGRGWGTPVPASAEERCQRRVRRVESVEQRADDQIALLRARLKKRAEAKAVVGEFELTDDEREKLETKIDILFAEDEKEDEYDDGDEEGDEDD